MAPKAIETEITIDAHVSDVWKILLDFPRYSQWNPYIRSVELPIHYPKLTESCVWQKLPMQVQVNESSDKTKLESPVCMIVLEDKELRWYKTTGGPNFVYKAEHYFILTERDADTTQLRHGERITGWLKPFK